MAYNDTPLPTDLISDSQSEIRENFQLLEDSQVVDEGSTADGDYIRYENGWQVCIADVTFEYSTSLFLSYNWDFPVEFMTNPPVPAPLVYDDDITPSIRETLWARHGTLSESSASMRFDRQSGATDFVDGDTADAIVTAIGRWK